MLAEYENGQRSTSLAIRDNRINTRVIQLWKLECRHQPCLQQGHW